MKKRLVAILLAFAMVLSMLFVMIFTVSAEDLVGVFLNENPNYVVPKTSNTTFYDSEAQIERTNPDEPLRSLTLWFNVRNLKTPIYLAAVTIGFKTDNGSTFGSGSTGGVNLQNYGFPIESDGDYLLRIPLSTNLAWNWDVNTHGGFKAITNVTGRAYDKKSYDNNGAIVKAECEVALMGILPGAVTLEGQSATYYNAQGATEPIGSGAPKLEQATVKVVPTTGDAAGGGENSWTFFAVTAPEEVKATPEEGFAFSIWVDKDGHSALPGMTDKLYATYKKAEIYTRFATDSLSVPMNSTGNKLTLRMQDPSLGVTGGQAVVEYDPGLVSFEGGKDGKLEVPFNHVDEDGKIAELTFDAVPGVAGVCTLSLSGTAAIGERDVIILLDASASITLSGQQTGVYFTDRQPVPFNKSEGDAAPATQTLWQGNAILGGASAFSVVYKLEGVDDPIDAYQLAIEYNGGSATDKTYHWFWNQTNEWAGAPSPRYQTFDKDGTYVMYIDSRLFNDTPFKTLNAIRIFTTYCTYDPDEKASNTNENATFQILAITAGSLKPTVTFHDAEGNPIGKPYTHDYVPPFDKYDDNTAGKKCKQILKLVSPNEIFETLAGSEGYEIPTKEGSVFVGWVDADGNPVGDKPVYMNMDVYADFDILDTAVQDMAHVDVTPTTTPSGEDGTKYTVGLDFKWRADDPSLETMYDEDLKNAEILAFGFIYANQSFDISELKDDLIADIAKQDYTVTSGSTYEWKNRKDSSVLTGQDGVTKGYYYYVAGNDGTPFVEDIASNIKFNMKDIPTEGERHVVPFVTLRINEKTYVIIADDTNIQNGSENG